jgi:hypothetical protein
MHKMQFDYHPALMTISMPMDLPIDPTGSSKPTKSN